VKKFCHGCARVQAHVFAVLPGGLDEVKLLRKVELNSNGVFFQRSPLAGCSRSLGHC